MKPQSDPEFYNELLRAYFDSANDAIFVLCDEMKFLVCNRKMQEWLGADEADLTRHLERRPITDMLGDEDAAAAFGEAFRRTVAGQPQRFECRIEPPEGQPRWVEFNMTRVDMEGGNMVISVARDVSERREYHRRLEHQATHDGLTGLPNRVHLTRFLQCHKDEPLAVLVLDLDRFKEINEGLGHVTGDAVLTMVAHRLHRATTQADGAFAVHLGADEFAVVVPGGTTREAEALGASLRRAIAEPLQTGRCQLNLSAAVGLAASPEHAATEELLQCAEAAMYQAKRLHSGMEVHDPAWQEQSAARLELTAALHRALRAGEVRPYYQPIVPIRRQAPPRLEALARWERPGIGTVAPGAFIGTAERTGLIRPLTLQMVRSSLAECAPLLSRGLISGVSINVSPRCLTGCDLAAELAAALEEFDFPASSLVLEITETMAMHELPDTRSSLEALEALGVRFAVDDFGTGHSSLSKLRQLPISELKIDRSFVAGAERRQDDAAIVAASVRLAHELGLEVVAEGVETEAAMRTVRSFGCDFVQGYLLARPMPLEALLSWLEQE